MRAERVNLRAEVNPRPKGELSTGRGSGGMLPGKFLNLMLQKRPFCAFLMRRGSRFYSPGIPKVYLIPIICLKRSQKTNVLMSLDKCDEPLQYN